MANKKKSTRNDTREKKAERDLKLLKRLEFLKELYDKGIPLEKKDLKLLEKHKVLQKKTPEKEDLPKRDPDERDKTFVTPSKTEKEKLADSTVDVVEDLDMYEDVSEEDVIVMDEVVYSAIKNDKRFLYDGGMAITKRNWMPKDLIYHTDEFVKWIDSINDGFQKMTAYRPFQLYCQQAEDWMAETENIYDYETVDQRREYAWQEMDRISENSLYFLDKYLHVKEATYQDGFMDYKSKPVHKVIAFLFDCGYSVEMGKPRQIAATTTLGGLALCKLVTKKNFFIKMIAQDKLKVQEIFDDKIKYPFSEIPDWMNLDVGNDSDNLLYLRRKSKKGKKEGVNSKIEVVAPTVSAINGGAPPLVLIDEGGYIGILGKMIKEARPTMFMQDEKTGKITQKRQIWIWGTGGEMDKKGKAYEEELKSTIEKWENREFTYGIIPIFFDWTTRPGMTKKQYNAEKKAYTTDGPDREEKMVQFHQTYPRMWGDMFLTSSKTLVSTLYINERRNKIRQLDQNQKEQYGFMQPIYDTTKPSKEHDDLPFEVIGAEFVPTEKSDPRATTRIFMHPKKNWKNRYYKGTDPIATDNGYSNMATSIWDAQFNTLSAIVNWRSQNPKEVYLQCMLLGLYYDVEQNQQQGIKDLLESNIGLAYQQYVEFHGYGHSLVLRSELPSIFTGGNSEIGIDNRGNRVRFIINKLQELIEMYGDNIYIDDFWKQLETFVCKVTEKGNTTWETQDKRKYLDDVLFSTVFSYICSLSFDYLTPINIERKQDQAVIRYVGKTMPDGTFRRVPVRVRV